VRLLIALTFAALAMAAEAPKKAASGDNPPALRPGVVETTAPKPPTPFSKTEQLAASVFSDMSQRLQQAIEEVTVEICKRAKIERPRCEMNWQQGVVAEKAPEAKPAVQ
jgi:hypothetical protein